MREIIGSGATTILVSHSIGQVREMCNKILWLHEGNMMKIGPTEEVLREYEAFMA